MSTFAEDNLGFFAISPDIVCSWKLNSKVIKWCTIFRSEDVSNEFLFPIDLSAPTCFAYAREKYDFWFLFLSSPHLNLHLSWVLVNERRYKQASWNLIFFSPLRSHRFMLKSARRSPSLSTTWFIQEMFSIEITTPTKWRKKRAEENCNWKTYKTDWKW